MSIYASITKIYRDMQGNSVNLPDKNLLEFL